MDIVWQIGEFKSSFILNKNSYSKKNDPGSIDLLICSCTHSFMYSAITFPLSRIWTEKPRGKFLSVGGPWTERSFKSRPRSWLNWAKEEMTKQKQKVRVGPRTHQSEAQWHRQRQLARPKQMRTDLGLGQFLILAHTLWWPLGSGRLLWCPKLLPYLPL